MKIPRLLLIGLACLGLAGCATDGYMTYGVGYGLGYYHGGGDNVYGTISIQATPRYYPSPYYGSPYYGSSYYYAPAPYYPRYGTYPGYGYHGYRYPHHHGYRGYPYYRPGMVHPPTYSRPYP